MAGLSFANVSKTYTTSRGQAVTALETINLAVREKEFVCLVGRSGCGKTTLLRIAAGLELSTEGEVRLGNKVITRPDTAVGMVFQEDRLFPWRTVRDNVTLGLEIKKTPTEKCRATTDKYLHLVGLSGFDGAYPGELSGGMKQRAAIARVLVNEPEVILMDEPFGSLDAQTRNQMQGELLNIWEYAASTVLFVTHSVDEAVVLADRVVVMTPSPGRIYWECPIDLARPRDRTSPLIIEYRRAILSALDAG